MELLSLILVIGFLRGLYYIFKEARNENIFLRIACFWAKFNESIWCTMFN